MDVSEPRNLCPPGGPGGGPPPGLSPKSLNIVLLLHVLWLSRLLLILFHVFFVVFVLSPLSTCFTMFHVVSHCFSSSCHACHVLCLWLLFMLVPSFVKLVMDLDSIASCFAQVLLFETRLSISF